MSKTVKISVNYTVFRKWDMLQIGSSSQHGIVINNPTANSEHSQLVIYPYKRKKTKLGKWLWFKMLKLKIWLKIIKTN